MLISLGKHHHDDQVNAGNEKTIHEDVIMNKLCILVIITIANLIMTISFVQFRSAVSEEKSKM